MENSKIEWTDHTFNPWHGCMKVSDGCKHCYAETLDKRWNGGHWGPGSKRKPQSDKYWNQPLKWNAEAQSIGVQAKVFCASMADIFEGHPDTLNHLSRLFDLIENTPWLIWQLLTKRPQNILTLIQANKPNWINNFPTNVWMGTSVENQKAADERIPYLLEVPAKVRFLSCEPLLSDIDLTYPKSLWPNGAPMCCNGKDCGCLGYPIEPPLIYGIHLVIAGGESGHSARPVHPDWVRSLRDQCNVANVPFFFKQWGMYLPDCQIESSMIGGIITKNATVKFPSLNNPEKTNTYHKIGKTHSGNLLDGKQYLEFPKI